jgi:hypothetical protein
VGSDVGFTIRTSRVPARQFTVTSVPGDDPPAADAGFEGLAPAEPAKAMSNATAASSAAVACAKVDRNGVCDIVTSPVVVSDLKETAEPPVKYTPADEIGRGDQLWAWPQMAAATIAFHAAST